MNKRGVYFFVVDAFIGGAIIMISLIIILNSYVQSPEKESPITILEDFMTYLQNTQVRDFEGNYTKHLINVSNITRTDNTLFEQVAEFHFINLTNESKNFTEEIVETILPEQFSLEYYYNDELVFEREVFPRSQAGLVLSTKKISVVTINSTFLYGPHITEVVLWTS